MSPIVSYLLPSRREGAGPAAAIRPLSDDYAIQFILADIPFFAVGLLAFGVFTFFLVLRRVDRLVLLLFFSIFFSFVAAIFDLIQILSRGKNVVDDDLRINGVLDLIYAREVLFAISFGLRNMFLWSFAALPPPGELQARDGRFHSGCWNRWGTFGIFLKWGLLATIAASTILQIIFRVSYSLRQAGPIPATEGVMQIVISAVLFLKLFMNTYLTGFSSFDPLPRWKTVFHYSPVMVGLLFSLGIAIGNVVQFLFTETVLGRFMQAVELYILILYVLISAFFTIRDDPNISPAIGRLPSFRGLPPVAHTNSTFHITPPNISTPDLASAYQRRSPLEYSQKAGQEMSERRPSLSYTRASSFSRMSSWMISRRVSGRAGPSGEDTDRLWNQDSAEHGVTRLGTFNGVDLEIAVSRDSFDQSLLEPKQSAKYLDPVFTAVLAGSKKAHEHQIDHTSTGLKPLTIPPRALARLSDDEFIHPITPQSDPTTDSPIYGLNGPVRPPRRSQPVDEQEKLPDIPRTRFNDSARSSGISGLLRQQDELDRSIAALKLFRASGVGSSRASGVSGENPLSAAGSEFSLSNFPAPPWGRASSTSIPTISRPIVVPDDTAEVGLFDSPQLPPRSIPSPELLPPPVMLAAVAEHSRNASVPYSDDEDGLTTSRSYREFSAGTQYEITSFIGGLSKPKDKVDSLTSMPSLNTSPESTSPPRSLGEREVPQPNRLPLRNLVLTPEAVHQRNQRTSEITNPFTQPNWLELRSTPPRYEVSPPQSPPRIDPGAGRGVFSGLSSASRNNRTAGLPPRPRIGGTGIRLLSPLTERPSPIDEYEHPRPAPVPGDKSRSRIS